MSNSKLSKEQGYDLNRILAETSAFTMCYAYVYIWQLERGSTMRRQGAAGTKYWSETLWPLGFNCQEYFMRAYAGDTSLITAALKTMTDSYVENKIALPTGMFTLPLQEWPADTNFKIIDGGHRTKGLEENHETWMDEHKGANREESPHCKVRILLYNNNIIPFIGALSKAANDSRQQCVPEDGLERFTFARQMLKEYMVENNKPDRNAIVAAKVTDHMLAKLYVKKEEMKATAKNYHNQLVYIAISLTNEKIEFLIGLMDKLESDENEVHLSLLHVSTVL
jgi:hypothetical protein